MCVCVCVLEAFRVFKVEFKVVLIFIMFPQSLKERFTACCASVTMHVTNKASSLGLQIVHNTAISKSQKVRFFTASTLAQIASLYKWNGILDSGAVDNEVKPESLTDSSPLSRCVWMF